jgi:hypothetical protein
MGVEKVKKNTSVKVGAGNFISQLFFLWVFRLIMLIKRTKDLAGLNLVLKKSDRVKYNDRILEKQWTAEITKAKQKNR